MNQLTFIDKIQVLFKLLFSSPIIIGIFAFSMILMILLFFYSKLNKKFMKYIFIVIYLALIGFAVFKYGNYFLTSIDSFVTLFMANIYFPIIPVYVLIMFISFIIMIVTLSNKNKHRFVKIINTVFFTLIQMLFVLFIYIVEANNIDISENSNLYSNEQTMTLLELGMGLFFIWLLILLIIFYLKKADKIFKVKKNEETDDFDEYINDYNEPTKIPTSVVSNATPVSDSIQNSSDVFAFNENSSSDSNTSNMVKFVPEESKTNDILSSDNSFEVNANVAMNNSTSSVNNSGLSVFDNFVFLDVSNDNDNNSNIISSVNNSVDYSNNGLDNINSNINNGISNNNTDYTTYSYNIRDDEVEVVDFEL